MRIGEFARRAGVNVQTVRFYERCSLLRKPQRTSSNYRAYAESDLDRIRFIRRSQLLGFTLRDIKQLLELHLSVGIHRRRALSPGSYRNAVAIMGRTLNRIDAQILALQSMRARLADAFAEADPSTPASCPASASHH
ncbi:MAG TPA: MerR family transcriptional regulator [Terriglobales bacterium]|nr:MerR family transcriptional regulator [Terriglobales bacterium]